MSLNDQTKSIQLKTIAKEKNWNIKKNKKTFKDS